MQQLPGKRGCGGKWDGVWVGGANYGLVEGQMLPRNTTGGISGDRETSAVFIPLSILPHYGGCSRSFKTMPAAATASEPPAGKLDHKAKSLLHC